MHFQRRYVREGRGLAAGQQPPNLTEQIEADTDECLAVGIPFNRGSCARCLVRNQRAIRIIESEAFSENWQALSPARKNGARSLRTNSDSICLVKNAWSTAIDQYQLR